MLWTHRIDINDPDALSDITALHHMGRSSQPVEINVARTHPDDLAHPTALVDALLTATQIHGHVLHLIGAPGYVGAWWKAIHHAAGAELDNRPELRIVDGGQP